MHEDEHLLVVEKPAGINTHAPSPYAPEGIYEWLRDQQPEWASLAIMHRLDKETSGLMLFSKTSLANRSLTAQFAQRKVQKKYLLVTDRPVRTAAAAIESNMVRAGDRYLSRPRAPRDRRGYAKTRFRLLDHVPAGTLLEARPLTGRTHQIRVHASALGFPVLGDVLYGGTPDRRLWLQAAELEFRHPATGQIVRFQASRSLAEDPAVALRESLIDPQATDCYRWIHGAADGWPGWHVDRLGDFLLSQSEQPLDHPRLNYLEALRGRSAARGVYHKTVSRQVRRATPDMAAPRLVLGEPAPETFIVRENGLGFALSFHEGYSVGLFLDQRENRRRLLTSHAGAGFPLFPGGASGPTVLNVFAYTCGFSVAAARAGARVASVDLSAKYLEWGRRNFALNAVPHDPHEFIRGDAFDQIRRLRRKQRRFDLVLLDPPTFSTSKRGSVFRAEKDWAALAGAAVPLVKPGGVLFVSTNAARLEPGRFLGSIRDAIAAQGRSVNQERFVPQPLDFPAHRLEPAYLKTVWLRIP